MSPRARFGGAFAAAATPLLLALLALGALVWAACNGDIPNASAKCARIPDGGCPSSNGPACGDPTCASLYYCNAASVWTFVKACAARDAGLEASDVPDAALDAPGPSPRDAAIDVPGANGGPGCHDLQPPDCPLGLALGCPSASCCGCEDLFVCSDGGWLGWGFCGEGGAITPR